MYRGTSTVPQVTGIFVTGPIGSPVGLKGGLKRLQRLCFRNLFSQPQNFPENFWFLLFAFVLFLIFRFLIFDFLDFLQKIIFCSRSVTLRDIAHTTCAYRP
jgi:hypothetical protein